MNQIEQIKAEIKRLKEESGIGLCEYDAGHENGICETCDKLLDFIDKLPKEQILPDTVNDNIEAEAKECWDYVFSIGWNENSLMTMNHKEFLAFAEHWAVWQRKQLIKDAVDGEVIISHGEKVISHQSRIGIMETALPDYAIDKLGIGEKVKLIILKNETD